MPSGPETQKAPRESIDDFVAGLSGQERNILMEYLISGAENDFSQIAIFRVRYGEVFDHLAFRVQTLISAYGVEFDAVRRTILGKLKNAPPPPELHRSELAIALAKILMQGAGRKDL